MTSDAHRLAHTMRLVGWLAICGWLLLCLAGEAMYLARWLAVRDSPGAHELLLGVSLWAFWAMPAILVVVVLSWITTVERGSLLPRRAAQLLTAVVTMMWASALVAAALS
jgi:hypothetical protein